MKILIYWIILLITFILFPVTACIRPQHKPEIASVFDEMPDSLLISKVLYAKGFDLYETDGIRKLVIYHPGIPDKEMAVFYIVDSAVFNNFDIQKEDHVIKAKSNRVAVFSATQLDAFDKLSLLDHIMGITEAKYLNNLRVKEKIKERSILELGANDNYFIEKIISAHPDYIFYSPYKFTADDPLKVTGIPLIPYFDFYEQSPLGRAEWIKFTAAFFDEDACADSIFKDIEAQYLYYCSLTDSLTYRPTVFSGKYFNGQWYVPGGKSYMAALFKDAGADYIWKDDLHTGSFPLDYETVYSKAYNADFWRIVGSYGDVPSYSALAKENNLYKNFKAFKIKHVIWCDAQKTAYFEKSTLEPHLVLADLIHAFHPEVLPAYHPKYYHILK